ncbi:MAG: type II toxin-antitoxin system RelE/ParE family toxin [bacterium]|nr:type II toxin-antitoxin system RelE/ParE family toxin [bacterium]
MKFEINFTDSANEDLEYFKVYEQKAVIEGTKRYLREDANVKSKKRKQLKPNELAPWELRIGNYRVFYDFEKDNVVKIIAVGLKHHNELYMRERRVIL